MFSAREEQILRLLLAGFPTREIARDLDSLAASGRVNELIASAHQADPKWFWKNVRALIERKHLAI